MVFFNGLSHMVFLDSLSHMVFFNGLSHMVFLDSLSHMVFCNCLSHMVFLDSLSHMVFRSSLIWVRTVCHRGGLNISADEKSRRLLLRLVH